MKPTREEILSLAHIAGIKTNRYPGAEELERFALAMYQRGAEDMRERAICKTWAYYPKGVEAQEYAIRDIPIGESND